MHNKRYDRMKAILFVVLILILLWNGFSSSHFKFSVDLVHPSFTIEFDNDKCNCNCCWKREEQPSPSIVYIYILSYGTIKINQKEVLLC